MHRPMDNMRMWALTSAAPGSSTKDEQQDLPLPPKSIKISLPPSVVAKMPSLSNTNLSETCAIINLQIPISSLRSQAQHVISPQPGDGSEDIAGTGFNLTIPIQPPTTNAPSYSPRLSEPEHIESTNSASAVASNGEHAILELNPNRDPARMHEGLAKAIENVRVSPTVELNVDLSHTLPAGTTVRSLLTECIEPVTVDDLIKGASIIKHNAAGGTTRRRIYLNFDDGTLRIQHTFFQSFFSDNRKGVYYLFKCYEASPWEQSARGKARMFKNKAYAKPEMNTKTLSLVMRGGGEALVATFLEQEDYDRWITALITLQTLTNRYFSFFAGKLLAESSKILVGRLSRSSGVWAAMADKRRKSERQRKARNTTQKGRMTSKSH